MTRIWTLQQEVLTAMTVVSTSGRNGDKANFKRNNTPPTKRHIADGIMHAVIGLAIIAFLIVIIYLYIYPKENCQLACSNVSIR